MSAAWTAVLVAAASGGGLAAIIIKLLSRSGDKAEATAHTSAAHRDDLEVLRGVIAELRVDKAQASARIDNLVTRVEKLEERERHALTRAAVHEAWDQLTFQIIVASNPNHPPPPPLRDARSLPPGDDGDPL